MCIICNATIDHHTSDIANNFLSQFDVARNAMKATAESMLEISKFPIQPKHKRQYDATHKRMVRLIRDWNRLEEFREQPQKQ